jgi:hypothetical protein
MGFREPRTLEAHPVSEKTSSRQFGEYEPASTRAGQRAKVLRRASRTHVGEKLYYVAILAGTLYLLGLVAPRLGKSQPLN